ncbi:hypothetical protein MIMGU_mgv11b016217mg [Erythranthe guttata]|uniref:KNOX1 domain-containing protein n=1 Tax=Erythranthe guttata TaxID=4155 RepID=A0A022R3Y7_ERYGU|nr:hypothetical protein MIMGU_mgv11b016217mg [Erythranthe guttata]
MPLHHPHYSDNHASVFRSLLPDHHLSPDDKPSQAPPPTTTTTAWLNHHHHHQWLPTQSQLSPTTPPDNNNNNNNDHLHHDSGAAGDKSNSSGGGGGSSTNWEREKYKADILSHPLYEQLLSAHVSCLRIATPVDQLPRIDAQLAQSQQTHYVLLLSSFKEQLQQHVRVHAMEAVMACWELEQSLQSLTGDKTGNERFA